MTQGEHLEKGLYFLTKMAIDLQLNAETIKKLRKQLEERTKANDKTRSKP